MAQLVPAEELDVLSAGRVSRESLPCVSDTPPEYAGVQRKKRSCLTGLVISFSTHWGSASSLCSPVLRFFSRPLSFDKQS